MRPHRAWAALWRYRNKADGPTEHLICRGCLPKLFRTRARARAWIQEQYGYMKHRHDLRRGPHGWRLPKAVRVTVKVEET